MPEEYTPDLKPFYDKYTIVRNSNGEKIEGPTFTLRPYDPHARVALEAYATSVERENPALAADLRALVAQHTEPEPNVN